MRSLPFLLLLAVAAGRAETAEIRPPDPGLPTVGAAALAAMAAPPARARPPVPLLPGADASEAETVVVLPDARGVLDATGELWPRPPGAVPNPFQIRFHPETGSRDVPLRIDSVLIADRAENACVVIDGRPCSAGETWEGMSVAAIAADRIDLRRDNLILRVPVRDEPVILRLPR